MTYKQWFKTVENAVIKRGFSPEYANAIAICVRGLYQDKNNYIEPISAAVRGIYPPVYIR